MMELGTSGVGEISGNRVPLVARALLEKSVAWILPRLYILLSIIS